jgi:hypothetical protein
LAECLGVRISLYPVSVQALLSDGAGVNSTSQLTIKCEKDFLMKEPRTPDRKKGGRRAALAKESSNTKLFVDDYVTVGKLIKSWGKSESEVIRIIVYDWLRANRVRALGQDEAAQTVRAVYERVVSEQVAPLARGIEEIKRALASSAGEVGMLSANGEAATSALGGDPWEFLDAVRALVEEAASDLSESGAQQLELVERVAKAQSLTNALLGETYAAAWSSRDWLVRYVIEVDILSRDKQPDEVDEVVRQEKLLLMREASDKIWRLEEFLKIPTELRLPRRPELRPAAGDASLSAEDF